VPPLIHWFECPPIAHRYTIAKFGWHRGEELVLVLGRVLPPPPTTTRRRRRRRRTRTQPKQWK